MIFEEFFKKKKINLAALQQAEPALFAEFKDHYGQMGEKSFDHTKKYWFNKLRLSFPTPIEVKTEKVKIENPLAEQTITEMLVEPATSKVAFKPRFKAPVAKTPPGEPADAQAETTASVSEPAITDTPAAAIPKAGFKPRFRALALPDVTEPVPAENSLVEPEITAVKPNSPAESPTAAAGDEAEKKPAYKPRFKMQPKGKTDDEQ